MPSCKSRFYRQTSDRQTDTGQTKRSNCSNQKAAVNEYQWYAQAVCTWC